MTTTDDLLATPDLGTGPLEHRDRVDFRALRHERAERVFALMQSLDLDACLFGREANARYATGVRRLWTSQTRRFLPSCILVRSPRATHLLSFSASYEGMPEEMGPDHYFPVTWNPMGMMERIARYEGMAGARRIGVDSMTPLFRDLLTHAFPKAELVAIDGPLREVRSAKLPGEITCIRVAAAIAESALVAAIGRIRPGVEHGALLGAYLDRMSSLGTSQFAQQGIFGAIGPQGSLAWGTSRGVVPEGATVACAGGALWAGYEGSLARTWWSGPQAPSADARSAASRWRDTTGRVIDALRPGASGTEVLAAFGDASDADADVAARAVYAVGLGYEAPVAAPWLTADELAGIEVRSGSVLAVRELTTEASCGFLGEELVLVRDGAPEVLTTLGHGPLLP
jgi:Xaa-Pro dipeptidase